MDDEIKNLILQLEGVDWKSAHDRLIDLGDAAIPFLIHALWNSPSRTRYCCVGLLGEIGHVAAVPELMALLHLEFPMKVYFESLMKIAVKNPESIEAKLAMNFLIYQLEVSTFQGLVAETLGSFELTELQQRRIGEILLKQTTGSDSKAAAARVFGQTKNPPQYLISALMEIFWEESKKDDRYKPKPPSFINPVLDLWYDTAEALCKIGHPSCEGVFIRILEEKADGMRIWNLKDAARNELVKIGKRAIPALKQLFYGTSSAARSEAAVTIGLMGEAGVSVLAEALFDEKIQKFQDYSYIVGHPIRIPYCFIRALGETRSPKALPHLIKAMENEESRRYVFEALGKIKDPSVLPILNKGLESASILDKVEVLKALAVYGDPISIPELINVMNSSEDDLPHHAAEAICAIVLKNPDDDHTEAVAALVKTLDMESSSLHMTSVKLLGEIGDLNTVPYIVAASIDEETERFIMPVFKGELSKIRKSLTKILDRCKTIEQVEDFRDKLQEGFNKLSAKHDDTDKLVEVRKQITMLDAAAEKKRDEFAAIRDSYLKDKAPPKKDMGNVIQFPGNGKARRT